MSTVVAFEVEPFQRWLVHRVTRPGPDVECRMLVCECIDELEAKAIAAWLNESPSQPRPIEVCLARPRSDLGIDWDKALRDRVAERLRLETLAPAAFASTLRRLTKRLTGLFHRGLPS